MAREKSEMGSVVEVLTKESPKKLSSPKKREGMSRASGILASGRHSLDVSEMMFEFSDE